MYLQCGNTKHLVERCERVHLNPRKIAAVMQRVDSSKGSFLSQQSDWAVKMEEGRSTLGYIVGCGREIKTLLGAGMTPKAGSMIITVKV